MALLDTIDTPEAVRAADPADLADLAREVRREIIADVAAHGGHLAASLGAVEICVALLRVFDPLRDRIVFDVGHQAYAWKILTGRRAAMAAGLREEGGPCGFPDPAESPCDAFVAGHAGVALAAAEGFAAAAALEAGPQAAARGARRPDAPCAVAVVGDASLANGGSLEALNNASVLPGGTILVLNDNKMSIGRNTGAIARFLGRVIAGPRYNRMKRAAEHAGRRLRLTFLRGLYARLKRGLKSLLLGDAFFEQLGFRYIGPIDGHDLKALENAFRAARAYMRPCVVHVVTRKGRGFPPAEKDPEAWHGTGPFDPAAPAAPAPKKDWSAAFGEALRAIARKDRRVVALSAAMRDGTGLSGFAEEFPDRFFDMGIAEAGMVSFAAGLAAGGRRPVVAVYSTFLQRAVDGVFHDVCLQGLPVVFAIDRAGAVGADGRTHQGVFDVPLLRAFPGISIMQPRCAAEQAMMLEAAIAHGGPAAIRWPRGAAPEGGAAPAPVEWGRAEILKEPASGGAQVWIWALGDMAGDALETAAAVEAEGFSAGVVNARFVKPVDAALLRAHAASGAVLATMENGALAGGFGSAVRETLADSGARVLSFGWPDEYLPHASVRRLKEKHGLEPAAMARAIVRCAKEAAR